MKYMKQFAVILAVTFAGEGLHYALPLPVPASIYGLVLMLVLLMTGLVKIGQVKETAEFLIEIMPMMFIPAGVGLMTAWGQLKPVLLPVLVMTVVSTFLVMGVTGWVSQKVMRIRSRETSERDIVADEIEAGERAESGKLEGKDE